MSVVEVYKGYTILYKTIMVLDVSTGLYFEMDSYYVKGQEGWGQWNTITKCKAYIDTLQPYKPAPTYVAAPEETIPEVPISEPSPSPTTTPTPTPTPEPTPEEVIATPKACMIGFLFGGSALSHAFPYLRMFRDLYLPHNLTTLYYHVGYIIIHFIRGA